MDILSSRMFLAFSLLLVITTPSLSLGAPRINANNTVIEPTYGATIVHETQSKSKPWDKEPETILGIKFGAPLKDIFVQCPTKYIGDTRVLDFKNTELIQKMCYDPQEKADGGKQVYNLPNIVKWQIASIKPLNDIIEGLELYFDHYNFEKIKALFLEKYGQSSSKDVYQYQNRYGAVFNGESYSWNGTNLIIILNEYTTERPEFSKIVIKTINYLNYKDDHNRAKSKQELKLL